MGTQINPRVKQLHALRFVRAERECDIVFERPSLTAQEFKDDCDINKICERLKETGSAYTPEYLRDKKPQMPYFADVSDIPDYQTAQNIIADAQGKFEALPAIVRARFENNPAAMLAFVADEANRKEAEALGLLAPKVSAADTAAASPAPAQGAIAPRPEALAPADSLSVADSLAE